MIGKVVHFPELVEAAELMGAFAARYAEVWTRTLVWRCDREKFEP